MTREEAINELKSLKNYYNDRNEDSYVGFDNEDNEALDMAIKALENKDVLDKVREEIVHLHDWAFSREEILRIIDKYRAESEE